MVYLHSHANKLGSSWKKAFMSVAKIIVKANEGTFFRIKVKDSAIKKKDLTATLENHFLQHAKNPV